VASSEPSLALRGIEKSFGGVRALAGASLEVLAGEIHALLGENGAGKSTLVSIAAGLLAQDAGQILVEGRPVSFASPRQARASGIALVPQHDLLIEAATVADNLALIDPSAPAFEGRAARRRRVDRLAAALGLDLGQPDDLVGDLPVGTRQRIEIAGALASNPRVLVLDEPTAVLSPDETAALFGALRIRADSGHAVVLITHRLGEVFLGADRLTLLARGRSVKTCRVAETTPAEIGALLLGSAEGTTPAAPPAGEPETRAKGATAPILDVTGLAVRGLAAPPAAFALGAGDLLVLLAIDGNGADVLAAAVAGLVPRAGRVAVGGRAVSQGDARSFRAAGGRFVPADRRAEGLVASFTLAENLALADGVGGFFMDRAALHRRAADRLAEFGVRASSPEALARELSGGNQQKLVLARELVPVPRVLVAVHPTRGLDLAASRDVHERIDGARRQGCAVLLVSADPEEARLFGGTLRVVYRGRLSEPLPASTPLQALGRRMAGLAA
jgi:general nucleoside transport system ATP-binding protein